MARVRSATNYHAVPLTSWQLTELKYGQGAPPTTPHELDEAGRSWSSALCPGTVASALRAQKAWDFGSARNFDESDWWYRCDFEGTPCQPGESLWLELDGLATIADVWLNGVHVLRSDNMFCGHELNVSQHISEANELRVRFSSLDVASAARRPRPRFKTRLIERQQLRWFRTTLLGRIPGWTPPVTAVGPWRGIRLVRRRSFSVRRAELRAHVEGGRALVSAQLEFDPGTTTVTSAVLNVAGNLAPFTIAENGALSLAAPLVVPGAERWWPHSYGQQPRYPARVLITTGDGQNHELEFDSIAFRTIELETSGDRFALVVNGTEVRCRGACWTTSDIVSLDNPVVTLETLGQVRAAGMNMVRVGGTMTYESDAFYEECDRSGILVWQDFMFANCDYPGEDPDFRANVTREAEQFLARSETRACLAVLCGNSEIEQQVSMLGLPRESWKVPLFEDVLRGIARAGRADVPYVTSTPTGGPLPFQTNVGVTHYYGVGAYLRPLEDARRADVKFAAECLAFANIPDEPTIIAALGDGPAPFHHPRWKARTPRDNGAGWDFDDVRDHYTEQLFGIDSRALRYEDPGRALALGRVASGEVMARTIAEWRRPGSNCRGALIWFLRDLWPGAGWGVIDSNGLPKAAYYYVKRAMQARALFLSDEGLNGLVVNVVNDCETPLVATLDLQLIRNGSVQVATGTARVEVAGRSAHELNCATLFEHFVDLTHAYRFGPRQFDVAVAALRDADSGEAIGDACYFPGGLSSAKDEELGLEATVVELGGDDWLLRLSSKRFAYAVVVEVPGFTPSDSYFNVCAGSERSVRLHTKQPGAMPKGTVQPLNSQNPTRITVVPRGKPSA
ncbi:MAG TPA: hypothetical protein VER96_32615 [Polyangiaceae bacterium]|nr:hypothetical protein [Polyangiaceae bacterium]